MLRIAFVDASQLASAPPDPQGRSVAASWHRLALLAILAMLAAATLPAADAESSTAEWQKFKGKPEPLPANPSFATPGHYLPRPDRTITFPAGGLAIDLPLDATFADGRPLKASLQANHSLWIDLDGDGKIGSPERFNPSQTGYGPITLPLKYKSETVTPYTFHLIALPPPPPPVAQPGQPAPPAPAAGLSAYRLVTGQMIRYSLTWNRHPLTILLIDENGDGRYDTAGEDVVLVDSRPGGFLSKTVTAGADAGIVLELLVYPDGTTLELRDYPGETGVLDALTGYTPANSGASVPYLAMDGPLARPGFSAAFPRAQVPSGSYSLTGAIVVNSKETVRVERGGLQPVIVAKQAPGKLLWGGEVQLKYGFRRDGDHLVFDAFQLVGKDHQEVYRPLAPTSVVFNYHVDEQSGPAQLGSLVPPTSITIQAGTLEADENGGWKPLLVKHKNRKMLLQLSANYPSGVVGALRIKDQFEFNPPPPGN